MTLLKAITIPRWGMTMTEGTICSWMVEEGQTIRAGQDLIEIETTKITNVVEAPGDGVLRRAVLGAGQTAPVGALAGVLTVGDVSDADVDAFVASYAHRLSSSAAAEDRGPMARVIEAGGWKLNILEAGPVDGEAVVLLHGFGGDLTTWQLNQDALAATRHVVAMDLPGHGQSQPAAGAEPFEGLAEAVLALIDALDLGRVHLVGHSLGGGVAARAATLRHDRVRSLTLIAPIGQGPTMDGGYLRDFIAARRRRPMQAVLERLYAKADTVSSAMVEDVLRANRLEGVTEALAAVAGAIADGDRQVQDLRAPVAALRCPVLMIWGQHDRIVPMPTPTPDGIAVETVPDAGHMPQVEQAAVVNGLIAAHLDACR